MNHARDKEKVVHVDTLVIGAGQAGLATAYELKRRGIDYVVLEAENRVGQQWLNQYDSLKLFTSNRTNDLPGLRFPGPRNAFATKDEVAAYLRAYAQHHQLNISFGSYVSGIEYYAPKLLVRTASTLYWAKNVVVATGLSGSAPRVPALGSMLSEHILQLHSSEYRRPNQLLDGPVLVVGAGHSGCDIALELAASRPVILCGRDTGEVPVPFDKPIVHIASAIVMFSHAHLHIRSTRHGRRECQKVRTQGAPRLRVKRAHLKTAGVRWHEQGVTGVDNGLPQLADGRTLDVDNVVWATGYTGVFSGLPAQALAADGWPNEYRGVSSVIPGLYFCGLTYQYSLASMNFYGVGADARHVAEHILKREHETEKILSTA